MDDDRFRAPGAPDPTPTSQPPGGWTPSTPDQPAWPAQAAWQPPAPTGWDPPPQNRGRGLLAVAAVVLAIAFVFSVGLTVGQAAAALGEPAATPAWSPSAERPTWELLDEAFDLLDRNYVDPEALDPLTLERGAITGLTDSLDDRGHTGYLTPEEVKARDEGLSGTFVGVGAVLDQRDEGIFIVRVLRDSPAERAGLRAGDEIVGVDGEPLAGLTIDQVVSRVRGPEGTDVTLDLRSPNGSSRELTITRAKLDLPDRKSTRLNSSHTT